MIDRLPLIMLYCLAGTVIIECLAAAAAGFKKLRDFIIVVLVNIMTNPALVSMTFFIRIFWGKSVYYYSLAAFEIAAVLAEGLVYKFTLKHRLNPFLLSLVFNASSFFIGALINKVISYF